MVRIKEILNKKVLSKKDIVFLLSLEDKNDILSLFEKADDVRKDFCGDEVHLRGIIEFSNYCEQDCLYCGLRKSNSNLNRYRMTLDEVIQTAKTISSFGIKTIVLQSGEDFYFTGDFVAEMISNIKDEVDTAITLSLGERDYEDYIKWRKAGADRYLLKHETANSNLYSIVHLKQSLHERIDHLKFLKSIGFQIGSGNLVGLPNQTVEDVADDILLCKELEVDMASISPFVPSSDTPYRGIPRANVEFTLKTIAVARMVLRDVHIPSTTALATIDPHGREKGLQVGANVVMPNYTPMPYREQYKIYENKKCADENPLLCNSCLTSMIHTLDRKVSSDYGHSLKN